MERAVVLGGGGVAGIAWLTGIVHGLSEFGFDPDHADLVVGTSAGATVAAQIASGLPLSELYQRQLDPALQNLELRPEGMSIEELTAKLTEIAKETSDPLDFRRRVGQLALQADTVDEATRRQVIMGRLPGDQWPTWPLEIIAVDAFTGETAAFRSDSGIDLVDAVAASCAVPGVWPPVTIGDSRFIDGGIRTMANVDFAQNYRRVLVIAPLVEPHLSDRIDDLRGRVELIVPDEESLSSFGTDVLSPATRTPAAKSGHDQGVREAERVIDLWDK